MASPTIACSGPIGEVAIEILQPFGDIVVAQDSSEAALLQILKGAVGLVLRGDGIGSARIIEAAPELKVIGRSGVGYDNVDIQAANARGIPVIITVSGKPSQDLEAVFTMGYIVLQCSGNIDVDISRRFIEQWRAQLVAHETKVSCI